VHAVTNDEDVTVGHAGFHGAPTATGWWRSRTPSSLSSAGRGYAAAALGALLTRAATDAGVRTVRATISPDNAASLHVVCAADFVEVGEQWDDQDGSSWSSSARPDCGQTN
jgi:RimJ/RimL family protein N-acetyltransferase